MVADFFPRKGKLKYYGIGRIYYHMHVIAVTWVFSVSKMLQSNSRVICFECKKIKLIIIHNKVKNFTVSVQFEACKFEKWIIIYPAAVREYKDF